MAATREQAQKGAALTNAKHAARIGGRRAQVAILRFGWPGLSAEEVARRLKCSPSVIRRDWRALRASPSPAPSPPGCAPLRT